MFFGQRLELSNIKSDFQARRAFYNSHYAGTSSRSVIRLDEMYNLSLQPFVSESQTVSDH